MTRSDTTYKIVRFYENNGREVIATGLTLEQAQAHCDDPETSSETATGELAVALAGRRGRWFDGYEVEADNALRVTSGRHRALMPNIIGEDDAR